MKKLSSSDLQCPICLKYNGLQIYGDDVIITCKNCNPGGVTNNQYLPFLGLIAVILMIVYMFCT